MLDLTVRRECVWLANTEWDGLVFKLTANVS